MAAINVKGIPVKPMIVSNGVTTFSVSRSVIPRILLTSRFRIVLQPVGHAGGMGEEMMHPDVFLVMGRNVFEVAGDRITEQQQPALDEDHSRHVNERLGDRSQQENAVIDAYKLSRGGAGIAATITFPTSKSALFYHLGLGFIGPIIKCPRSQSHNGVTTFDSLYFHSPARCIPFRSLVAALAWNSVFNEFCA